MKNKILLIASFFASSLLFSQTTLSAGDIAILQYNADGTPEIIKFLALRSMEAGTTINFTDDGWKTSTGAFKATEDTDVWTAPNNISCGEVISFTFTNVTLNQVGDQILAYQGTVLSPTFLFAINNYHSAAWKEFGISELASALPSGLTDGVNAVAIAPIDNVKYTGSLTGTKAEILTAICTPTNWTGSNTLVQDFSNSFTSKTTWTSAWSQTGSPNDYLKTIIDGDYDTATNGDFTACDCQINTGKIVTVNAGGTVTVENGITNNGTILIEDNGALVQNTSDGTNTGSNYTVNRETSSLASKWSYTYWSSPLTSSTLAEAVTTSYYYSFTAASQSWTAANSSTSMTPGIGYIATGPTAGTYPLQHTASFTGSPFNNGNISVSLGMGTSVTTGADDDWNLIGNPYPSAIDANLFLTDNASTLWGTIYLWTHNTAKISGVDYSQNDYAMWNSLGGTAANTGGATPDGNIASGQAFFAQAFSAGTATFTNNMRISGNNSSFFKSTKKQKKKARIWMSLTSDNSFSQILIGFTKDATLGVDQKYDGERLEGGASANFYSLIDSKPYGIQGLPTSKKPVKIPLGFDTTNAGEFTISIDHLEGLSKASKIHLVDHLLNTQHNLKDSNYTFFIDNTGVYDHRFSLNIQRSRFLDIKDLIKSRTKLQVKNLTNTLEITASNDTIIQEVVVYDILGREITRSTYASNAIHIQSSDLKENTLVIAKILMNTGEVITKKLTFNKNH